MVCLPHFAPPITWDCEGDATGRRGKGEAEHIGYRRKG
jgi:hypothetical protein